MCFPRGNYVKAIKANAVSMFQPYAIHAARLYKIMEKTNRVHKLVVLSCENQVSIKITIKVLKTGLLTQSIR